MEDSAPTSSSAFELGLVIIPAYNEAGTLFGVLEILKEHLPPRVDVLVVNDGSGDATSAEAKRAGVRVCTLPCNLGYTQALRTGLRYGLNKNYAWMSFMDADGQHRPQDMKSLIELFREKKGEVDLITGSRWMQKGEPSEDVPTGRRMGMIFFSRLSSWLTGERLTDTTSGMKILKPAVAQELLAHNFGDFHSEALIYLHDRGFKLAEHPIIVYERTQGSSMYSFYDAIFYPLKNLILILVFKLNSLALKKVKAHS